MATNAQDSVNGGSPSGSRPNGPGLSGEPVRVYVVEDDDAVRDSLVLLLRAEGYDTDPYASPSDFLKLKVEQLRGCAILDIRMPGMSGMELHGELIKRQCRLPVIFVTGHGDVPLAVEAIKSGALDFIQKPYQEEELLSKVREAIRLEQAGHGKNEEKTLLQKKIASLTPRETEIMDLMIAGNANKVIAIDLNISQRTVEIHRSRVMQKMGTHSLAQLVQMVMTARED
ncbi:response regulator transcription factor [Allohahella marinimesophila]|uniref:Response regulator FixJ n=1 Tax=Allohahella marinimesophila TaxID=1054972 RepID=A0ABP7PQK9_9GAMM